MGGGGPRFWSSFSPEPRADQLRPDRDADAGQARYAGAACRSLQHALSREITGARVDVEQLETGPPVGIPVAIRLSGDDIATLRALAPSG